MEFLPQELVTRWNHMTNPNIQNMEETSLQDRPQYLLMANLLH
jgi:hypothetical protein